MRAIKQNRRTRNKNVVNMGIRQAADSRVPLEVNYCGTGNQLCCCIFEHTLYGKLTQNKSMRV